MKGKLYLIPTTLGDFDTIHNTIPSYNIEIIRNLSIFIVENVRTARRFISKTKHPEKIEQTREVLAEIGAERIPYLLIYNKIDICPDFRPATDNDQPAFAISAMCRKGIAAVQAEILAGSSHYLKRHSVF